MPDLLPALAKRRARRAFDPQAVPTDIEELLWAAVSVAPSHGNAQPTRLLVPRSAAVREALVASLSEGNRAWAPAAPLLVALGALPSHSGRQVNSDGSERPLWSLEAGIALGNLLAQATELGLIAHPMAGFDEVAARAAFAAPQELRVLVVVAVGYPGDGAALPPDLQPREHAPQERIPPGNLVVEDRWNEQHGVSARELRKRAPAG